MSRKLLHRSKIAHFHLPAEWKNPEIRRIGPFAVEVVRRLRNGNILTLNSRAYRKGFAPRILPGHGKEIIRSGTPMLFVLSPKQLNWWIGVLFMIGSLHFVAGSWMSLANFQNALAVTLVYFLGSIFFTSAAYIQYFQAINADVFAAGPESPEGKRWFAWQPRRIDFWVTFTQFVGTVLFNINTFNPFWAHTRELENLFVWVPNIEGSILFMISGTLAMVEICGGWCWRGRDIEWWLTSINFLGCVAFLGSALLAFSNPHPLFQDKLVWSIWLTLIGAVCFFLGAYLMLPEMSERTQPEAIPES
jgi:hypothetical protein